MRTISLTTDFGWDDWFVGMMKGVILNLASGADIIDLTHGIPAGDIRTGAFALMAGYRFFPRHTVHVAIVDPGVGSARGAVVVETGDYTFVAPDNGVLSWALRREKIKSIHWLENKKYFLLPISRTFHGRDIFAPVAAQLSKGLACRKLGSEAVDYARLPWTNPKVNREEIKGEVIYLDRFGNAITNVDAPLLSARGPAELRIFSAGKPLCAVGDFYQSVPDGKPIAVIGSSGYLEIAVNGGSAAKQLGLRVGDSISVRAR
jgi:S-adenosylmethionine hydrolase